MNAVFADAYYFIAVLNPHDAGHSAAISLSLAPTEQLVTTEWVLVEVAHALSAPRFRSKVTQLIAKLEARSNANIVHSPSALWVDGLSLYEQRPDKSWSLTDCLSFVVMRKYGIQSALTLDAHFEQAGFSLRMTRE